MSLSRNDFRPEIQGLRAVAVAAVAVFHVWPTVIPGGYVGVDVFFVISGFLITGALVREGEGSGRIDLVAFYLRRARRLLPAAMLVLLVVGLLTPLLLPSSQWRDTAYEILSSTFYVENWRLADQAVDYMASENAPSPVQHYWSLSIEEQFYLFWPLLIIAGLAAARFFKRAPRAVLRMAFGVAALASLAASVWLTESDAASAYFVTHTRIWELALGGFLALGVPSLSDGLRRLLGFTGMAAILAACLLFSPDTAFPGYAALLPTLGTALVIVSGETRAAFSVFTLLKTRPFQFLGDISYSLYLWHWPLIVFLQPADGPIGVVAGLMILAASVLLATWSKIYVEDRFRARGTARAQWRPAIALAASLAIVPAAAFGTLYLGTAGEAATVRDNPADYPGAMALSSAAVVPSVPFFAPPLALVKSDAPATRDCRLSYDGSEPVACRFGNPGGRQKIFLIGDSHAEHWIPAFAEVAARKGWNAASYTKSSCPFTPDLILRDDEPYAECLSWGRRMLEIIGEQRPDAVVIAQMNDSDRYPPDVPIGAIAAPLAKLWRDIELLGPKVVVIADTPAWGKRPDDCLAQDPGCAVDLRAIAKSDPLVAAHDLYPRAALLDFTDMLCPSGRCPAAIGNVVVWRDRHHLTATYARSMADIFGRRLDAALTRD